MVFYRRFILISDLTSDSKTKFLLVKRKAILKRVAFFLGDGGKIEMIALQGLKNQVVFLTSIKINPEQLFYYVKYT